MILGDDVSVSDCEDGRAAKIKGVDVSDQAALVLEIEVLAPGGRLTAESDEIKDDGLDQGRNTTMCPTCMRLKIRSKALNSYSYFFERLINRKDL